MNRRDFVNLAPPWPPRISCCQRQPPGPRAAGPRRHYDERFLRHRFGVNYVPSRNWYYCYNDWDAGAIARDFDRIAEIGADHLRVMVIWPWFQPNPIGSARRIWTGSMNSWVSAAGRKLDVLPTLFTGWLSGFRFSPPYLEKEPFLHVAMGGRSRTLPGEVSGGWAACQLSGLRRRQRDGLQLAVPAAGGRCLDETHFQSPAPVVSRTHPRQRHGSWSVV